MNILDINLSVYVIDTNVSLCKIYRLVEREVERYRYIERKIDDITILKGARPL